MKEPTCNDCDKQFENIFKLARHDCGIPDSININELPDVTNVSAGAMTKSITVTVSNTPNYNPSNQNPVRPTGTIFRSIESATVCCGERMEADTLNKKTNQQLIVAVFECGDCGYTTFHEIPVRKLHANDEFDKVIDFIESTGDVQL
jgi:hypothetical protein